MDYNKFNIEKKYDSYKDITIVEAEKILLNLEENTNYDKGYDYYILKGKMLLKTDKVEKAIEDFERALAYKETDEVYDILSYSYYEIENYELALHHIELSLELNRDEYVYNHKGKILEKLGRLEECFENYYIGLKYALASYSKYGDVEIFGENLVRIGGMLKNTYSKNIVEFIKKGDYYNLYEHYIKLLNIILKEEENDNYHSGSEFSNVEYLELIEEGKFILIDNDYFIEMINIYKKLYEIEKNSEYDDMKYINRNYIDKKIKELVDYVIERTSLTNDSTVILEVLDEVIKIKNSDYFGYLYHKGFIFMRLKRYEEGINVLIRVIDNKDCNYSIRVQGYECIIKTLDEDAEANSKWKCEVYREGLSELLKFENDRLINDDYLSFDEKCDKILHNCKRAMNLSLDNNFWYEYMEKISLEFGEKYEAIVKNQSTYKIIENYNKAINIYDGLITIKENCAHGYYRKGRAIVLVLRLLNSSKTSLKDLSGVHGLDCFAY